MTTLPSSLIAVHGRVWIGCSGWAYPTWSPEFYPPKTSAKKMLQHYATQLNSVEVNYTFRHLPSATTVEGWLAQTGPDFRFSFKAPQRITHIKRLKECSDTLSAFYSALLPVIRAGRMGVVLFQLPPNLKVDASQACELPQGCSAGGHCWGTYRVRIPPCIVVCKRGLRPAPAASSRALCSRERRVRDAGRDHCPILLLPATQERLRGR